MTKLLYLLFILLLSTAPLRVTASPTIPNPGVHWTVNQAMPRAHLYMVFAGQKAEDFLVNRYIETLLKLGPGGKSQESWSRFQFEHQADVSFHTEAQTFIMDIKAPKTHLAKVIRETMKVLSETKYSTGLHQQISSLLGLESQEKQTLQQQMNTYARMILFPDLPSSVFKSSDLKTLSKEHVNERLHQITKTSPTWWVGSGPMRKDELLPILNQEGPRTPVKGGNQYKAPIFPKGNAGPGQNYWIAAGENDGVDILITVPEPKLSSAKDFAAYEVLLHKLGGDSNSVLFQNVRAKKSLVYSISALRTAGLPLWEIRTTCKAEDAPAVLEEIGSALNAFNVSTADLDRSKKILSARIKETFELPSQQALASISNMLAGRSSDAHLKKLQALRLLQPKDLGAIASQMKTARRDVFVRGPALVPVDIERQETQYTLAPDSAEIKATTKVIFKMKSSGYPFFDMLPTITALNVDGKKLNPGLAIDVTRPEGLSKARVIQNKLSAGDKHTITVDFALASSSWMRFQGDELDVLFFFNDFDAADGRGFMGRYSLANFAFDQYESTLEIKTRGYQRPTELRSNGVEKKMATTEWKIDFPKYFNASSIFMHLSNRKFYEDESTFLSVNGKKIPVLIYGSDKAKVMRISAIAPIHLAKLEELFGPYPHAKLLIYAHDQKWGMEFSGAAMITEANMLHELVHSWYGRSVFPRDGNAAWIDEAIAIWVEKDFPRLKPEEKIPGTLGLASRSPFFQMPPAQTYKLGWQIIARIDHALAGQGGIKPVLKRFLEKHRNQVISNDDFYRALRPLSPKAIDEIFHAMVF